VSSTPSLTEKTPWHKSSSPAPDWHGFADRASRSVERPQGGGDDAEPESNPRLRMSPPRQPVDHRVHHGFRCDASVREGTGRIVKRWDQIDVLVNNAGIERAAPWRSSRWRVSRGDGDENYFGAIAASRPWAAMRHPDGCIIKRGFDRRRPGRSPLAPYTASKFALEALSESLAQEVKRSTFRVAIVEPALSTPDGQTRRRRPIPSAYPQQRRNAPFSPCPEESHPTIRGGRESTRDCRCRTWQLRIRWDRTPRRFSGGVRR